MNTKERLEKCLDVIKNNACLGMDEISWEYEEGVLISGNEAKDYLRLLEQEREVIELYRHHR